MAGETGSISVSQAQAMVMIAFAATAYYNTIETFFSIFTTFKRRRGRYFWSMVVSNTGININVVAFVLRYFGYYREAVFASSIIIPIAWYSMVTGQAVVLWSRLHLVVHSQRQIRLVLAMIVFNAVTMHVPETVIFFLANYHHPAQWSGPFKIYEKVELVVFTVQETIIAGFFLYEGYFSLKPLGAIKPKAVTSMVRHLAALFAAVLLLDAGLIVLEYSDRFEIQTMCKPFVYSVKLKVEFVVLNKLLSFTRMSACNCRGPESMPSVTLPDSDNRTRVGGNNVVLLALPDIEQTGGSLSPLFQQAADAGAGPRPDRIFDGQEEDGTDGSPARRRRRSGGSGSGSGSNNKPALAIAPVDKAAGRDPPNEKTAAVVAGRSASRLTIRTTEVTQNRDSADEKRVVDNGLCGLLFAVKTTSSAHQASIQCLHLQITTAKSWNTRPAMYLKIQKSDERSDTAASPIRYKTRKLG
ncbi:hypothetical protein Cob_v001643 [Colletotrichum orbiculare MAFF 240422]|uniref:DUF7703 domain-containing protein n=1 Tax=Colletotrichum orbiculare (strain 104-T / ATCC 96160 / CBS 514.97 / LARS 414 / MAFF 240422) TaxID=1213857 RepID=A0A484G655_COLOR|nr:hypothetical protein Cob_v001643 [Colletotrichum orbiculare MAFF 240422]